MKKQFFYAAMAIAFMASCTSEDNLSVDPVNPTPEEDKVAIELGIDSPTLNAEVGGRATGSVGDIDGVNNTWNSQQLFITMFDKNGNLVKDGTNNLLAWDTYEYRAPQAGASGDIRIYVKDTYEKPLTTGGQTPNEQGKLQYVYYPVSYAYDFYGWHLDDATHAGYDNFETSKTIENIVITGRQDIMGARTKEFTYQNYVTNAGLTTEISETDFEDLEGWDFSARTARNKIKPILKFEHQLARLKFFVRAGSETTALYDKEASKDKMPQAFTDGIQIEYDESGNITNGTGKTVDPMSTLAMYVTGITAQNMSTTFSMNLNDNGKISTTEATTPVYGHFTLGSKQTDDKIGDLVAVAPEYKWEGTNANYPDETAENQYYGTPIGESIIFFPSENKNPSPDAGTYATVTTKEIALKLDLKQFVIDTEDERDNNKKTYKYKEQSGNVIVKAAQLSGDIKEFKAGYSYNVYITIYGFERIEVSAELTPWEMGGDVDVDIEEDAAENDDTDEPSTQTTKEFNFTAKFPEGVTGLTAEFTVTEVDEDGNETPVDENENDGYDLTIGKKYKIIATANDETSSANYSGELEYTVTGQDDENTDIEITLEEIQ